MKTYTVKELYKMLGRALKKLPFQISYHGKVIAEVTPTVIQVKPEDIEGSFDLNPVVVVNHNGKLFRHYVDEKKPIEVFNTETNRWEEYVKEK